MHDFFGSTHTWAVGRYVFAVANTAALRYSAIASASGVVSGSSATDLGFTRVSTNESITLMAIASFTSTELNITNSRDIVTSTVQAWWGGNRACPAIFGK